MGTVNDDQALGTEAQRKTRQINDLIPALMALRADLRGGGLDPSAVALPAYLDPGCYDGEGATDAPAQLMGLPVLWGDRAGLVVEIEATQ